MIPNLGFRTLVQEEEGERSGGVGEPLQHVQWWGFSHTSPLPPERCASQSFLLLSSSHSNQPKNLFLLCHFPGTDLAGCVLARVQALPAWGFSLHHFLFVLQEKGIRGSVLDILPQAYPYSSSLNVPYCHLS